MDKEHFIHKWAQSPYGTPLERDLEFRADLEAVIAQALRDQTPIKVDQISSDA